MSGKKKQKRTPAKPRDPFWRVRRMLVEKRKRSAKLYRRVDTRKAERDAHRDEQA